MSPWRMEEWLRNMPGAFPTTTDEEQPTLSTPASEAIPSTIAGEPASSTQVPASRDATIQMLDDKIAALEREDLGSELLRLEAQVSKLERRVEVYKKDPDQDMRADREAIMRCREDIRAYGGYLDAQSKDLRACSEEIERLRMVTSDS